MAEGIVLAGGYSSRFRTNKMTILLDGKPLIRHTVDTMKKHVTKVYVVTGFYHEEIVRLFLDDPRIETVRNADFAKGMFTSIKQGVAMVKSDFFLIPGDCPLVEDSTYQLLLHSRGMIRVPVFETRRGHPIFVEKELIPELLAEPDNSNLRQFRDRHEVTYVETDDEGIVRDIDTLTDLDETSNKLKGETTK